MEKLPIEISFDDTFFREEERCGYKVTKESKQLWAVLLDLMVKFDNVCRTNHIRYSIDSGTLLGAVRHKGFIPWDNDIDVIMLRSEYERLCKIGPEVFQEPYFWQTNETDPGTLRRHAQLRNSRTTCILTDEMTDGHPRFSFNQGVFLDVFILDEVPDDAEELQRFRGELEQYLSLLWDFKEYYHKSGRSKWMEEAQRQAYEDFEKLVSRYNGTGMKRVGNMSLLPLRKEKTLFAKELFQDLVPYQFEEFSFLGPRDYETILTGFYGDWHQLVMGTEAHGGVLLDMQHPYTDYLTEENVVENQDNHPILELYRHRNLLLVQRDEAWATIQSIQNEIEECRKDQEKWQLAIHDKQRLSRKVRKYKRICYLLIAISSLLLTVIALIL